MLQVDTRVAPGLHPARITKVEGYGTDTAPALASTEAALQTTYQALSRIHTAREEAKTNKLWTDGQKIIATDDFADKLFPKATMAIDKARQELKEGIDALDRELSQPIQAKVADPIAAEIRACVRGLPSDERTSFVMSAVQSGNEAVASAVLGTEAFLSGIDPKMQATLTRQFQETTSPDKAKRLKAMRGAQNILIDLGPLVFAELTKAVGAGPDKVHSLRKAKAKIDKAFTLDA